MADDTERRERPILLKLDGDEALLLFEWLLHRKEQTGLDADPCERALLGRLEGQLEEHLVSPFRDDYEGWLRVARERVLRRFAGDEG